MTVHLLRYGRTLCGMEGVPADWPEGHSWVADSDWRHVTCRSCMRELKEGNFASS